MLRGGSLDIAQYVMKETDSEANTVMSAVLSCHGDTQERRVKVESTDG